MLSVGSVYGHGFDRGQRERLEELGFALRPDASRYMGSQLCHFLDFPVGPSLELIEVTDYSDYESFVPPGMEPYCPGISLLVDEGSPAALDGFERDLVALEPYRLHVSYHGAEPDAPGWHYLNFARPVVAGTFVWLTAYDEPRPIPVTRPEHPNGVRAVVGLVFDLGPTGLGSLSRLAGQPIVEGAIQIGSVTVTGVEATGAARVFPLRAVVLQADSLEGFATGLGSHKATRFLGRPARSIETNPLSWEMWVTTA